jgi:hypothetical protein
MNSYLQANDAHSLQMYIAKPTLPEKWSPRKVPGLKI